MIRHGSALYVAAVEGRLLSVIRELIPREQWALEHSATGIDTLMVYAGLGPNGDAVRALLAAAPGGYNLRRPMEVAISHNQPAVLELMCAAGGLAHVSIRGESPLLAQATALQCWKEARILIASGARLRVANAFQTGVLKCRSAVAALHRVKRVGVLPVWDKYLLALIALELWTTRAEEEWQE